MLSLKGVRARRCSSDHSRSEKNKYSDVGAGPMASGWSTICTWSDLMLGNEVRDIVDSKSGERHVPAGDGPMIVFG
jgi:hypothetical protein